MISYQDAKEIIDILTKDIDCDVYTQFKFHNEDVWTNFHDMVETKNPAPQPPDITFIRVRFYERGARKKGLAPVLSVVQVDAKYDMDLTCYLRDFKNPIGEDILKNLPVAHEYLKLMTI